MLSPNKKKNKKKIEETIESVIEDDKNPFSTFDNFWWEEEMFSEKDSAPTIDAKMF